MIKYLDKIAAYILMLLLYNKYFQDYQKTLYFHCTIFVCAWKAVILCSIFEEKRHNALLKK